MTPATKIALDLYAKRSQYKVAAYRTEEQTRGFDSFEPGQALRTEMIGADVRKWVDAGEELCVFCKGNISIKRDLQEEIKKIDARVRAETDKFDSGKKARLDQLNGTIRKAESDTKRWGKRKNMVRVAAWLLSIGWFISAFAIYAVHPTEFMWRMPVLTVLGPIILIIVLRYVLCGIFDDFVVSPAEASKAKEEIAAIQKERAELIASIEKEKEPYLAILELV